MTSTRIDLRSDTVTLPTAAMKEAMASAPLGDDVFGEDPTVLALQAAVAELLGKEAALFVPSGTMSNQIALLCHTTRGDEVYAGAGSHCVWYESGAGAAWSGVQFVEVGSGGLFSARELEEVLKPREYHCPNPRLVVLENTHNRGGGKVFPQQEIERIAEVCRRTQLAFHLDGARLWNAAVASGVSEREIAAPFATVSVCFSKGLGAPIGSALVGSRETMAKARRFRKMLGGGMRQAGVIAAACEHALSRHRGRLSTDHANARAFARVAREGRGVRIETPETNIVMVDLDRDAAEVAKGLASRGVMTAPFGPRRLRVVTHLDVTTEDVETAARHLVALLHEGPSGEALR